MGASELRVASVQYVQAYDFLFFVAYSYRVADAVASAATVRASVSGLRVPSSGSASRSAVRCDGSVSGIFIEGYRNISHGTTT